MWAWSDASEPKSVQKYAVLIDSGFNDINGRSHHARQPQAVRVSLILLIIIGL